MENVIPKFKQIPSKNTNIKIPIPLLFPVRIIRNTQPTKIDIYIDIINMIIDNDNND